MYGLGENDYALLELSAMKPISYLPPFHLSVAEQLVERGLLRREGQQWHPTLCGLRLIGRTLH
jgi:hypothetical protein